MPFSPVANEELILGADSCRIAEHPAAPGLPYGQEGRQAVVYQAVAADGHKHALKVFKPRYRIPSLVSLCDKLAPFADLSGLQVCRRSVLTPQLHESLLRQHHDLVYAVLMPWMDGATWMEVILDGQVLAPGQCLSLSCFLAQVLATMEQQGLAHCDLSGPNVMILEPSPIERVSSGALVELVDVEGMYGPELNRPRGLAAGSPGYAHRAAAAGLWTPEADRFAGAVLLAEMLGWCDQRVPAMAWGESYFDPDEMQKPCDRYRLLAEVLSQRWGEAASRLFQRAWCSETLADCATFGEWLVELPATVPAISPPREDFECLQPPRREQGRKGPLSAPAVHVVVHEGEAKALEQPGRKEGAAGSCSLSFVSATSQEEAAIARLFHEGVVAHNNQQWRAAQELLGQVVRLRPAYQENNVQAAALLDRVRQAQQPRAPEMQKRLGLALVGIVILMGLLFAGLVVLGRTSETGPLGFLFAPGMQPVTTAAPSAAESARASLHVRVEPKGALVLLDGLHIGTSPVSVELPPGEHIVRVEKEGYEPLGWSVNLSAGTRETLSGQMIALNGAASPTTVPVPNVSWTPEPVTSATITALSTEPPALSTVYIEYVLDASDSMMQSMDGNQSKLAVVQSALTEHWRGLPGQPNLGFRALGHRLHAADPGSCLDTERLALAAQGQVEHLVELLATVEARGMSALSAALTEALDDFSFSPDRINALVLIADSGDNCDEAICATVQFQRDAGIELPIYVVGLEVDEASRSELTCIAEKSGGLYSDARSSSELLSVLDQFGQVILASR